MPNPTRLFDEYLTPATPPVGDAPPQGGPHALHPPDFPLAAATATATATADALSNDPGTAVPHGLPPAPPRAGDGPAHRSPHTGFSVRDPYLAFWTSFGAALCGEPLTDEVLIDGRRAQVFERLVLEEIAPGRVAPMDIGAQWLIALAAADGRRQPGGEALVIADRIAEFAADPSAAPATRAPDASAGRSGGIGGTGHADGVPAPPYARRTLSEIRYVVVHHTGAAPGVGPEAIAREHRDVLGWPGIGYHFLVDADGGVHQTQDLTIVSHHARQFNAASVGVALCGNFDDGPPPPGQLDRAAALIAHVVDRLGLPLDAIRGHGELVPTECPGRTYLGGWQAALLDAVAHYSGRVARRAEVRAIVPLANAPVDVAPTAAAQL